MKRFSTRATVRLVKEPNEGVAVAVAVGGASVGIKRDRQRLSGAKRRDRYNRLGSARHYCMENWMRFSRKTVSNIIFRGR